MMTWYCIVGLRGFIHERNIFIFFLHFFLTFSFVRAVSAALVLKVVVVQRFGGAVCAVLKNGAVLVSRHARFGGVHFSPDAARRGCAGVLAELAARGFQLGGFA
jgi:hypothetical protein